MTVIPISEKYKTTWKSLFEKGQLDIQNSDAGNDSALKAYDYAIEKFYHPTVANAYNTLMNIYMELVETLSNLESIYDDFTGTTELLKNKRNYINEYSF